MKIVILKEGKRILSIHNKEPKRSKQGDVDIMIDTGNKLYFSSVVAGNYYKHYTDAEHQIDAISWHGYYEIIDEKRLYTPIVHLKSGGTKIDKLWHFGSVNDKEPFAFPVCSFFVPANMDISHLGPSEVDKGKSHCVEVDETVDLRLDFFVLSKNITVKELMDSPIFLFYKFADIELFNTPEGIVKPIEDAEIEIIEDFGGNDVIIRTVRKSNEMFKGIEGTFSLIIHDPNDNYNRMLNRMVIEVDESDSSLKKPKILKDMHEDELN